MTDIKPMKILFFISSMGVGGAERVASTLCNYWANNNQQVILVTLDSKGNDFYQTDERIIRYSINSYAPSNNIFQKIIAVATRILRLRKIVSQQKPDLVLSFLDINNMLAILACLFTKVPVIITEHTYPPYFKRSKLFDWLRKKIYRMSTIFVTQTRIVSKWAEEFMPVNKIAIIANPLEIDSMETNLNQGLRNEIIAVGRLCPEKGFDILINVFNNFQHKYPDWQLTIIGEGAERKNLEAQLKELNLSARVKLTGKVESLKNYYTSAKIFVLSSRVEGFPMVLLEAMAHQLAVVSFDCTSGPADIISDGVNGLLVPQNDQQQLALAIQRLMRDAELRDSLSKEAVKVREKYKIDLISAQWLKLFDSVV